MATLMGWRRTSTGRATAAQFYLAPMQSVFGTPSVPAIDGLLLVSVGAVFFAILEAEKQLRLGQRREAAPSG